MLLDDTTSELVVGLLLKFPDDRALPVFDGEAAALTSSVGCSEVGVADVDAEVILLSRADVDPGASAEEIVSTAVPDGDSAMTEVTGVALDDNSTELLISAAIEEEPAKLVESASLAERVNPGTVD